MSNKKPDKIVSGAAMGMPPYSQEGLDRWKAEETYSYGGLTELEKLLLDPPSSFWGVNRDWIPDGRGIPVDLNVMKQPYEGLLADFVFEKENEDE